MKYMFLRGKTKSPTFAIPAALGALALVAIISPDALARVGGGQSYGGGSRGGGGGGLGGLIFFIVRTLFWLTFFHPLIGIPIDIMLLVLVAWVLLKPSKTPAGASSQTVSGAAGAPADAVPTCAPETVSQLFDQLRRFDPNFSEIIFTDFCYALYGRAQHERATGRLDDLSPYISDEARRSLSDRNPPDLREVAGIIVGAMQVVGVDGLASPLVRAGVEFEANYTEVTGAQGGATVANTWYVRERWQIERKRDLLSPPPAAATALHCPRCGAALQKDTSGACAFCGARIESGEFQWYVRSITLLSREARGPLLTQDVPEQGTDDPTVVQPGFQAIREAFEKENPSFEWRAFQERAVLIFNELQAAWSNLDWERARPHETDNIFQMHRYWIEAYRRQNLRNVLDSIAITAMQPVKIKEDAFYQAITLRIYAQGHDYTVDSTGRVVSGSKTTLRRWSEYWTFIRNRTAKPAPARAALACPNCGAPLKVNTAGICEFCGGKITSGEFDWVLSRIEQDESYRG